MAHLLISAAHKSSGKTTVSIGLCAAWASRGLSVQAFKKGPDYIDPLWLSAASGRPCYNLDFYTQRHQEIRSTFARHHLGADLSLIEGNKGLHDGVDIEGTNSSAALAKLLHAPVVLVIDTQGITRSVAPLLLGFQQFEPEVKIAGVIFNKVGGSRHEGKLRAVVERYTDIPVLGAIQRDTQMEIIERHLGLMPSNEAEEAAAIITRIAALVENQVDLTQLQTVAAAAQPPAAVETLMPVEPPASGIRLGIFRDAAFGFYYADDLDALHESGVELVNINALKDPHLPSVDGLFIGGGFPETQMAALETNSSLRAEVHQAIEAGLPVYAECGGLMYLTHRIKWRGRSCEMVGAINAEAVMHERPVGRGYVKLTETSENPWPSVPEQQLAGINAHEFHYSSMECLNPATDFAYQVQRGAGIINQHDGIVYKNTLATYAHQRNTAANPWVKRFVAFIQACKQRQLKTIDAATKHSF